MFDLQVLILGAVRMSARFLFFSTQNKMGIARPMKGVYKMPGLLHKQ